MKPLAYYNENDTYAAQWLHNLIDAGHIAPGDVDTRSIVDVTPSDLDGYTQCHFFAGIGGWSLALRQANVPDTRKLWTGSCPCQALSQAGKRRKFADTRHLWPAWFWLIRQSDTGLIFGEQVAGPDAREWLDFVSLDLEALGYAFGAADMPVAGINGPQIRQRLGWVAYRDQHGRNGEGLPVREESPGGLGLGRGRDTGGMANARGIIGGQGCQDTDGGNTGGSPLEGGGPVRPGSPDLVDHTPNGHTTAPVLGSFWSAVDWLLCQDLRGATWRPVEPGTFPLGHGIPSKVGRLRAYGNAISPPLLAEFVMAAMEAIGDTP